MLGLRRSIAIAAVALAFGGATGVAVSKNGDDDTTTTDSTTGTTTGTTTDDSPPTQGTTGGTTPRAPRITEVEVDARPGKRLRLRAEVRARGRAVTSVRFIYRGRTIKGRRDRGSTWARTVTARGGDHRADRLITVRVRACAGARCTTRTVRDEA